MRVGRIVVLLPVAAAGGYVLGRRRAVAAGPGPTTAGGPAGSAPTAAGGPAGSAPTAADGPPGPDSAGDRVPADALGVPGIYADKPTEIPAAGWRQILRRAARETKEDGIPLIAAGVAFYAFLALFPALIAAVSVYGLVADPAQVREQVRGLSDALPPESARLIADQLTEIASGSDRALGLGLVLSLGGALFTASGGVANLIKAINLAYDEQETRGLVKLRALALLLTLGAVVFLAVAVGLIAVLPVLLDAVGLGPAAQVAAGILRWVGLVVFVTAALAILYRFAPDRDRPRLTWVSLGAAVATLLWILGSVGFSVYVRTFGNYSETYGALAGVVVLLLWLFLTAFIVLLGAEINSETEQQTARDSTVGPPKPLGERDAVKADTVPSPTD